MVSVGAICFRQKAPSLFQDIEESVVPLFKTGGKSFYAPVFSSLFLVRLVRLFKTRGQQRGPGYETRFVRQIRPGHS